jgi:intracellular sulfur oxidation DsrE/DsrF family protein
MTKFSVTFISFILFSLFTTAQEIKYKVVWDLSSSDTTTQAAVFRQMNNVRAEMPDVELEVVFHGKGIYTVMKDSIQFRSRIKIAKEMGVSMVVCNNSMKRLKIDAKELASEVVIVPSAMAQLIKKQAQGWSYIKASH